jgi:hypothetical protein
VKAVSLFGARMTALRVLLLGAGMALGLGVGALLAQCQGDSTPGSATTIEPGGAVANRQAELFAAPPGPDIEPGVGVGASSALPPLATRPTAPDPASDRGKVYAAGDIESIVEPLAEPGPADDTATGPYIWLEDVHTLLVAAGAPAEWIADLTAIAQCESGRQERGTGRWYVRAGAVGDGGNSLGMWQLWHGWYAAAGESLGGWRDPATSARVAVHVRRVRGRFGGAGGWSCADRIGMP